jgi:predicted nucleic acid-binding protein
MPSKRRGLPFIDANVFIRFIAGDEPEQKARAAELFHKLDEGKLTAVVPPIVIFETVFTLSSPRLYHLSREQIVGVLRTLIGSPQIKVINEKVMLAALDFYLETNLPFGDCFIAATMQQLGSNVIYSFDAHFDRIKGITRKAP